MKTGEVRSRYLEFFEKRGHVRIEPAPLIPKINTGTLFTPFGMQQLVEYLLGKKHPDGKRLVNSQSSIRLDDLEEVGDNRHTTFFEMLGNWSLGDYFKEDQLKWFFEFLTDKKEGLGIDPKRLYVSVFGGHKDFKIQRGGKMHDLTRDEESIEIWKKLFKPVGIDAKEGVRIKEYPAEKNWWSMNGVPEDMQIGDIGGPDSEVFYDFGEELKLHENSPFKSGECHQNCDCGRFLEIGNSVFMQYKKIDKNSFEELPNKNVDFGGGLERLAAATNNDSDVFKIDLFENVVALIKKLYFSGITDSSGKARQDYYPTNSKLYENPDEQVKSKKNTKTDVRIIADHLRASTFLIKAGVSPSNKERGYVLRKLLRRSAVKTELLKERLLESGEATAPDFSEVCEQIIKNYDKVYFNFKEDKDDINKVIKEEMDKFGKTLHVGLRVLKREKKIDGKLAFDLYQTNGFPLELTLEILEREGKSFSAKDKADFEKEFARHKERSRTASAGSFKGGLVDHSKETIRLHTATHLLQAALRQVLGDHVTQRGQNIKAERSRFDFSHNEKLSEEELKKVEDLINKKIKENLPVSYVEMSKEEAEKIGAIHAFNEKYADTVKVYYVGKDLKTAFSKEFCGGPHVNNTSELGRVRIKKQKKIGSGLIRVYVVV